MAATACAYPYDGARPPLMPATPARPSQQAPDSSSSFGVDDGRGCAVKTSASPAPPPPPPPPPPLLRPSKAPPPSSILSHRLGLCTEGLGSESSGDIDLSDLAEDVVCGDAGGQALPCKRPHHDNDEEKTPAAKARDRRAFPPPISVIGAGGKPWLYLRPQRADGRLVLREVRIPSRELLQARREGGRFKLQFAAPQPAEEEPVLVHHQCQQQGLADAMVAERGQKENE